MAEIVNAVAFANNEVAFIAWEIWEGKLPDCLGFHIVREHLDDQDEVVEERPSRHMWPFRGNGTLTGKAKTLPSGQFKNSIGET